MRHSRSHRLAIATLLALPLLLSTPQPARAQLPVTDAGNLATRLLEYATQALEYAEAVQGVLHLGRQVQQLDSTFAHHKDAAMGRVGQLTDAFSALSSADASLLLDADFGAWRNRLSGTSNNLAAALGNMDGTSLSDYLLSELAAADSVTNTDLLALYPHNAPLSTQMAADWVEGREAGDRLRVADLATAEAGGRLFALLEDAQSDIDGRRAQGQLSHTALQQAQIANQLTAAELEFARAQLLAIQAQQDALVRHEAELQRRRLLQRWVQRETAWRTDLADLETAEEGRRTAYRGALRLIP